MPLPKPIRSRAKPRRQRASKWRQLEKRLDELPEPWCSGEVLNLLGWETIKYKETGHDIIVLAELTTEVSTPCPCGASSTDFEMWGFTELTYVVDKMIRNQRTRIYFRQRRKRCTRSGCGKTFQQPLPGVDARHALTTRLIEYIKEESLNIFRTFSDIADKVGVGEQTIRNIFTAYAKELQNSRSIENLKWLAIDEVHPSKDAEYCVITDPEHQQVLDVLPNNKSETLIRWLLNLPPNVRQGVEIVTIDMWAPYRFVVRKLLPNARIVVDRYHVHNLLSVALKQVMDVVRANMSYSEQRAHMRRESLLLKNYRQLSKKSKKDKQGKEQPSEKDLVKKWLKAVPDIASAYKLVSDFSDILQLYDRQKAEELTDLWMRQACEFVEHFRAKYEKKCKGNWKDPFGNVPVTISEWRPNILNYVEYKCRFGTKKPTNSFAEFANGKIKQAYRLCNGLAFDVLRSKVVFGGILVKRRPPHPLDKKTSRVKRVRAARQGEEQYVENPEANVAQLKKAREDADDTKDLLPNSKDNQAWLDRFGSLVQARPDSLLTEQEPSSEATGIYERGETQQRSTSKRPRRRMLKHSLDQIKMF